MIRVLSAISLFALTACAGGMPDPNEPACNLPTTNEWLRNPPPADRAGFASIDASRVRKVSNDLPAAIALLAADDLVQISSTQVGQFTQEPPGEGPAGSTAYLVRAVYPTPYSVVRVGWLMNDLHVFAGGLGCAPFEKHPIIVYLDRQPESVFVSASSAL